jgi:hypothetical protein
MDTCRFVSKKSALWVGVATIFAYGPFTHSLLVPIKLNLNNVYRGYIGFVVEIGFRARL